MTVSMPHAYPTVLHMLAATADAAPDRLALRCGNDELTYREYLACVAGFACELDESVRGGRVALIMANSVDIAIAFYAVGAAGAQVAPLNPAYTAHELRPILEDAAPSVIVYDKNLHDVVTDIAKDIGVSRLVSIDSEYRLTQWRTQTIPLPDFPEPHALSTLQYTGGTTGRSKGVNLTHSAVSTNVAQREALLPSEDGERVLVVTPLYHSYAIAMGLYLTVYCRGTLTALPRYRPDDVLKTIEDHRITLFAGSPTLFVGLMGHERFNQTDFSSLKLCFSGASALPVETLRRWEQATGCSICEGYGQSEAGPVLTYNPRHGVKKPGSAGAPLPLTEIEIVDTETGRTTMPPGEPGEIRVRGPQIMSGYRNLPDETAAALKNGWLYTGDIGALDDDGYLIIQDRKKDMVIVGGFNVYPREIEEVLCAHPAVVEAAVIGVPDNYRGEVLRAYVVARNDATLTEDDLFAYTRERLTKYKVPASITISPTLPKTSVGKIDKVALRTQKAVFSAGVRPIDT